MGINFSTMQELSIDGVPLTELYIDGVLVWSKSSGYTNLWSKSGSTVYNTYHLKTNSIAYTYPQVIRIKGWVNGSNGANAAFGFIYSGGSYVVDGEGVEFENYSGTIFTTETASDGSTVVVIDPAKLTSHSLYSKLQTMRSFYFIVPDAGIAYDYLTDDSIIITLNEKIT